MGAISRSLVVVHSLARSSFVGCTLTGRDVGGTLTRSLVVCGWDRTVRIHARARRWSFLLMLIPRMTYPRTRLRLVFSFVRRRLTRIRIYVDALPVLPSVTCSFHPRTYVAAWACPSLFSCLTSFVRFVPRRSTVPPLYCSSRVV